MKFLLAIFLQRVSEEEEAREGKFSQTIGCLDAQDAFLQVPQEKPWKVNLRGVLGEEKFTWAKSWSKSVG